MADDDLDSLLQQYYGLSSPDYFSQTRTLAKAPPRPAFPGDPSLYQGSIQNLPDRPEDPVEAPVAESLSPTMGAYGMGQALADTYASAREGHWNDAAKMGLPLLGMFAGVGARTADMAALAKAHEMAGKGLDRGDIWHDTGWYQHPLDKGWRFEIPDNEMSYAAKGYSGGWGENSEAKLSDVLGHDKLYEAYPDMKDVDARWRVGPKAAQEIAAGQPNGEYFPPTETGAEGVEARGATKDDVLDALLHEGGVHGVGQRENFARGSSPAAMRLYQISAAREFDQSLLRLATLHENLGRAKLSNDGEAAGALQEEIRQAETQASRLADIMHSHPDDLYQRSSAEAEAANVLRRRDWTPGQRQAEPPWVNQPIPEDRQIFWEPPADIDQILRETYGGPQMSIPSDKGSSVSGNPSEQVDTSRPLASSSADPRYKGFDTSTPLYHSTKADFTDFAPNTHFGTVDQANMRNAGNGARVIPAYPKEWLKYATSRDTGDWSSDKLKRLARQGYDGVRYLNRYEGIPLEAFERARAKLGQKGGDESGLDKISDAQFRKLIPEAQDSVIIFDPKNIKPR